MKRIPNHSWENSGVGTSIFVRVGKLISSHLIPKNRRCYEQSIISKSTKWSAYWRQI